MSDTVGKSFSYAFASDGDGGHAMIIIGRINDNNEWEYHTQEFAVRPEVDVEIAEQMAAKFFVDFMGTVGRSFYNNEFSSTDISKLDA